MDTAIHERGVPRPVRLPCGDHAFKNFLRGKSLEDLTGDTLVTAFKKIGFVENSVTFNTIRRKVVEDGLDAAIILETAENDIVNDFELSQCEEDKERFLKMRAILRKTIILRNPIPDSRLNKKTIENFSKDEIYQLLEEKIKSIDDSQSQRWYSFIEREGLTGACFVEYNENDLATSLALTNSQKITLGKLLQKIDPPVLQGQSVVAKHGAFGVVGNAKVSVGRSMHVQNGISKTTPSTNTSSEDSSNSS